MQKLEINGHFEAKSYVNYIEVDENNHKLISYLEDKNRPYIFTDK